jgi:hypothetical protein
MVDLILVDLGYLDSCIVIAPHNVKFDTTALCNENDLFGVILGLLFLEIPQSTEAKDGILP